MRLLIEILLLSIAVGSISLTSSKSKVLRPVREWIQSKSQWLGNLVYCHWCTSHWVAFFFAYWFLPLVWREGFTSGFWVIDWIILSMILVAGAQFTMYHMFMCIHSIPRDPHEDESGPEDNQGEADPS